MQIFNMVKIVLLITLALSMPRLWAIEPDATLGECEAELQAGTGLELALKKYRLLLERAQQTSANSGASIAQKLILRSLQAELRGYGWTDEQIAAIEPQGLEGLLPPSAPTKVSLQSSTKYQIIFVNDDVHSIVFADGSEIKPAQFVRAYLAHEPFQTRDTFPSGSHITLNRRSAENPVLGLYVNGSASHIDTQTPMFAEFMDGLAEGYNFFPSEDVYEIWGPYTVLFARKGRQPNAETLFMKDGSMILGISLDPVGYKISADQKTMYLRHGTNHISVITLDYMQSLEQNLGVFMPEPL